METALEGLTRRKEERAAARGWERDTRLLCPRGGCLLPVGPGSEGRPCFSSLPGSATPRLL